MFSRKPTLGFGRRILGLGILLCLATSTGADDDKERNGEADRNETPVVYQFFIDGEFFGLWNVPKLPPNLPRGPGSVTLLKEALGMTAAEYEEFLKKVAESKEAEQNCSLGSVDRMARFYICHYIITAGLLPGGEVKINYQSAE